MTAILTSATLLLIGAVGVLVVFGLIIVGHDILPKSSPTFDDRAMAICSSKGGTPILENQGTAYKACSMPGDVKANVK